MSVLRFFAVVLIFGCVSVAWVVLGGAMWIRTEELGERLSGEMARLWGPREVVQAAPFIVPHPVSDKDALGATEPGSSDVEVALDHQHRYKGLLWYSTFTARFKGRYSVPAIPRPPVPPAPAQAGWFATTAPRPEPPKRIDPLVFMLPANITSHDALNVQVDGVALSIPAHQKTSGRIEVPLNREAAHEVVVAYVTYGQDVWQYAPTAAAASGGDSRGADQRMGDLRNFSLTLTTDFEEIDYPSGSRSPTRRAEAAGTGMSAQWRYDSLVSNQAMGIVMPKRPDAGPIVHRMSLFAPASLFFFFTVLFTVIVIKKIELHPMHYLFIAAAFFAFHLLLAYLCDQVNIHAAFWISAAVSVVLVVSYMRLAAGVKFAVTYVALAQLVYLVGFSYAFFYPGQTGLAITIGAILTLFVLMQATGRVKWSQVFARRGQGATVPPLPPVLRPA
ncbi:MAG: inner membrane CreD family protein [Planctomycetaceae bacterium]|nr:inner membrane CreD family protein [Planctomycetaceae bacterium]